MITIDDREARMHPAIHNAMVSEFGREAVTVRRVDFGDYLFDSVPIDGSPLTIGIELSSVSDVCGKVDSGRLSYQLSNMVEQFDIPILLIESPISADRNGYVYIPGAPGSMPFDRLASTLSSAQMHGVRVLYASKREACSRTILQLYRYWQKPPEEHGLFKSRELLAGLTMPLPPAIESRVLLLMALPGVGEDRAKAALDMYGSLHTIFTLPESSLRAIPGWGAATAAKVRTFIDNATRTEGAGK